MSEKSTDPGGVFEEDVDRVWINTSEGSFVVDPTTWIVTRDIITPYMKTRLKNDDFNGILKDEGATGAFDYLEGLREKGIIEWFDVAVGQHRYIFGRDAKLNPFSVDVDGSE